MKLKLLFLFGINFCFLFSANAQFKTIQALGAKKYDAETHSIWYTNSALELHKFDLKTNEDLLINQVRASRILVKKDSILTWFGNSFNSVHKKTLQLNTFKVKSDVEHPTSISFFDDNQAIFCGMTNGDGLEVCNYDFKTKKSIKLLIPDYAYNCKNLIIDSNKNTWLLTTDYLFRLKADSSRFEQIMQVNDETGRFSNLTLHQKTLYLTAEKNIILQIYVNESELEIKKMSYLPPLNPSQISFSPSGKIAAFGEKKLSYIKNGEWVKVKQSILEAYEPPFYSINFINETQLLVSTAYSFGIIEID